jgi:hypothetical protein
MMLLDIQTRPDQINLFGTWARFWRTKKWLRKKRWFSTGRDGGWGQPGPLRGRWRTARRRRSVAWRRQKFFEGFFAKKSHCWRLVNLVPCQQIRGYMGTSDHLWHMHTYSMTINRISTVIKAHKYIEFSDCCYILL